MSRVIIKQAAVLILIVCFAACSSVRADDSAAEQKSIEWVESLDVAFERAAADGKIIMVDCYTDWCKWCKVLETTTLVDKDVVDASRRFVNVKVDGDAHADFVRKYRVSGYPLILFLDSDGKEVYRVAGVQPALVFAPMMNDLADGKNPDQVIAELVASTPEDAPSLWRLVHHYMFSNNQSAAEPLLEKLLNRPTVDFDDREQAAKYLATLYLQSDRPEKFDSLVEQLEKEPDPRIRRVALKFKLAEALQFRNDYELAVTVARQLIEVTEDEQERSELEKLVDSLNEQLQGEPETSETDEIPSSQ